MIAVIDSGSGGANVIKECLKMFNEDFIYLVDNKNCPYGNKKIEDLKQIIIKNIDFLLKNYNIDIIVVGCNTLSSILTYKELESIKCPIVLTSPDIKSIVENKKDKLIFATKNTIKYSKIVRYYMLNYGDIKTLYIKDLPKYIDDAISENCTQNMQKIEKILKKCLFFNKNIKNKYKNVKNIALGCTHFRHISEQINEIFTNINNQTNKCNCIKNEEEKNAKKCTCGLDKNDINNNYGNHKCSCNSHNINFSYCENLPAKLVKMMIKNNKKSYSIKVLLTKKDDTLQKAIERMFVNI